MVGNLVKNVLKVGGGLGRVVRDPRFVAAAKLVAAVAATVSASKELVESLRGKS